METCRAVWPLPLLLACVVVACGAPNGPDDDRAVGGPPAAGCPVMTRGGRCRAATPKEVVTIASGGFLLPAAGFSLEDGGYLAFSVRWSDAKIVSARTAGQWVFDPASTLPWDTASGATGATIGEKDLLYFIAHTPATSSLQLTTIHNGVVGAPVPVAIDGESALPSWPQAVGLRDGRVLLAFVIPQSRVVIGADDGTGTRFHMSRLPLEEPDLRGVLAHVGTTARGSWVLTYQVADAAWQFRSHVLLSNDEGRSWSDPKAGRLAEDEDVLHAFPIARVAEGADVYYVKTARDRSTRTVWRRAVHEDGTMGPEQMVTSTALEAVANPQPRRLPDGRIALMLAIEHSATEKDLALVVLDGDAP